jgi:hypothetical protein
MTTETGESYERVETTEGQGSGLLLTMSIMVVLGVLGIILVSI